MTSVPSKRSIFRGKNLGDHVTDAQWEAIRSGTFDDLFVGDYWVINDITWRIVDINYWLGTGDAECTTPHLVIMPDAPLTTSKMNETNTTAGGYVGAETIIQTLSRVILPMIKNAFGENNILSHREYYINVVTNGYPAGAVWTDSMVLLPNEVMMYGSYMYTPGSTGAISPRRYTVDRAQLSLMRLYPKFISPDRISYWLRDIASETNFCTIDSNGGMNSMGAGNIANIRPVFGIK